MLEFDNAIKTHLKIGYTVLIIRTGLQEQVCVYIGIPRSINNFSVFLNLTLVT